MAKMNKQQLVEALLAIVDIGYTADELNAMTNKELGTMLQANTKPASEETAPVVEEKANEPANEPANAPSVEPVKKEPKVTAKQRAYELFKNNEGLKSSELLDLVCKELAMDRKVASSYLCYYRRDNNIVAQRGLSKEEKLKSFINEYFETDLTEGQMIAILNTINEE